MHMESTHQSFVTSNKSSVSTDGQKREYLSTTGADVKAVHPIPTTLIVNDNTPLNTVVNDNVANSADDENSWPGSYLLGELDAGLVQPGDEIEYTVYFLNAGERAVANVRICDWIQPNQTFVTLPGTTGQGTPTNAYEFFRFTTQVND